MLLLLLKFLVRAQMLSLVAAWGCHPDMVLLTGAGGTLSSHFPAWRGPHDEHKDLLWARGLWCDLISSSAALPTTPRWPLSPLFLSSVYLSVMWSLLISLCNLTAIKTAGSCADLHLPRSQPVLLVHYFKWWKHQKCLTFPNQNCRNFVVIWLLINYLFTWFIF